VHVIRGADMARVTVPAVEGPRTAVSTDERALAIDREQYELDDGPCLCAARSREIVRVDMAAAQVRWPVFTASARRLGVGSYLAAPLTVADGGAGALNLFGFGSHGLRTANFGRSPRSSCDRLRPQGFRGRRRHRPFTTARLNSDGLPRSWAGKLSSASSSRRSHCGVTSERQRS